MHPLRDLTKFEMGNYKGNMFETGAKFVIAGMKVQ
jgi:hypothetical protein